MDFGKKITELKSKITELKNIDLDSINKYLYSLKESLKNINIKNIKKYLNKFKEDKRYLFLSLSFILGIIMIFVITYSFKLYFEYKELNEKTSKLKEISLYNLKKDDIAGIKNVGDIVKKFNKVSNEKKQINNYFNKLQSPYNNFLKQIYLPSLNIWKDPYKNQIDTNLVGSEFLEENKYVDTNLLNKWSTFFKDVGVNVPNNEITDIQIGDIKYNQEKYFKIPINVKFNSPTRRSFLMLVNKLSLTSNKKNIALLNEFMYNLWNKIKSKHKNKLSKLENKNKAIGEHFYRWINNEKFNNKFLEGQKGENLLLETIESVVNCNEKGYSKDRCFYEFRDKYSNIPFLAYKISTDRVDDKTKNLKKFLSSLPPLINIKNFTFKKLGKNGLKNKNGKYEGKISIEVYGRSISEEGEKNISKVLGKKCLGEDNSLTISNALSRLEKKVNYSKGESISSSEKMDYLSLKKKVEDINSNFGDYSNYKKAIKYFEIYRMFKVNSLCANK